MEEDTRVEEFIISKEDVKKYFEDRLIISSNEYFDYLKWRNIEDEKVV